MSRFESNGSNVPWVRDGAGASKSREDEKTTPKNPRPPWPRLDRHRRLSSRLLTRTIVIFHRQVMMEFLRFHGVLHTTFLSLRIGTRKFAVGRSKSKVVVSKHKPRQ